MPPDPMAARFTNHPASRTRALAGTPDIEIENNFRTNVPTLAFLQRYFTSSGLRPSYSHAHSLYLDTLNLDLLGSAGLTLRHRLGGTESNGEVHTEVSGIKYRHTRLTLLANTIMYELPLSVSKKLRAACAPLVRGEIERSSDFPRDASELRFEDLPYDLRAAISGRLGWKAAHNLVFKPVMKTDVLREKYTLYLRPGHFELQHKVTPSAFDFESIGVSRVVAPQAEEAGDYMCIELSLDTCRFVKPRREGTLLRDVLSGETAAGPLRIRDLGGRRIVEYEFNAEKSGPSLLDRDLVKGFAAFGLALHNIARSQPRPSYFRSSASKGVTGIGLSPLTPVQRGRFREAQYMAP